MFRPATSNDWRQLLVLLLHSPRAGAQARSRLEETARHLRAAGPKKAMSTGMVPALHRLGLMARP